MIGYKVRPNLPWFLILLTTLLVSGCLSHNAPKVTYFSLLTMEQLGESEVIDSFPQINLGIGPIGIPDSLKRSQIATRQQGNQYEFDEFNRWAGVLEKDFASVLGDNLGQLLGVEKVGFYPWLYNFKPTYRVVVNIIQFDGSIDGEATLSARWTVSDAEGKDSLAAEKSVFRQPLEGTGFAALIKAESRLVADLSKEIAGAIVSLRQ